ncbi:hypothetical protein SAMN05444321_3269 [Bradyrhizobium lablabi]|nr:hypothetical protein SAMN05444321_3269 [Bradyrhizobium lablabi]
MDRRRSAVKAPHNARSNKHDEGGYDRQSAFAVVMQYASAVDIVVSRTPILVAKSFRNSFNFRNASSSTLTEMTCPFLKAGSVDRSR